MFTLHIKISIPLMGFVCGNSFRSGFNINNFSLFVKVPYSSLKIPVLVETITNRDGSTVNKSRLWSPQKRLEMFPGVLRNIQWCDLKSGNSRVIHGRVTTRLENYCLSPVTHLWNKVHCCSTKEGGKTSLLSGRCTSFVHSTIKYHSENETL